MAIWRIALCSVKWIIKIREYEKEVTGNWYIDLTDAVANKLLELKAYWWCTQASLPSWYTPLEYVQADWNEYFDTWLYPKLWTKIEIDIAMNSSSVNQMVFWNSASWEQITLYITNGWTIRFDWVAVTNVNTSQYITRDTRTKVSVDKDWMYFNWVKEVTYTGATSFTANNTMYGLRAYNSSAPKFSWKLYWWKVREDEVLVAEYIPCKRWNTVWIYDKVSGKIMENLWTWTFTAWPSIITPSSPVDIVCNNWAIKAFSGNKWTSTNELEGYIIQASTGQIQENSNYNISVPIFLKAGDYSVSYNASWTGARPFTIWESDEQGNLIGDASIFTIWRPDVWTNTWTFTIDRDMYVRVSRRNDFTNVNVSPTNAILYVDWTTETIWVFWKNRFNKNSSASTLQQWSIASATWANSSSTSRVRTKWYVFCKPNTTYTVSCEIDELTSGSSKGLYVFEYNYDGVSSFSACFTGISSGWKNPPTYTFTTWATTNALRFVFAKNATETSPSDISNIQLELWNQATTYEPYYDGWTATAQDLLWVWTYLDEQEILSGNVITKVGVMVFDGTENWVVSSVSSVRYVLLEATTDSNRYDIVSSHFNSDPVSFANMSNNSGCLTKIAAEGKRAIALKAESYATLNAWKQFLADQLAAWTPVIVVYPLSTPTTLSVAWQTLSIPAWDSTIEIVEWSILDLPLYAKYKANE